MKSKTNSEDFPMKPPEGFSYVVEDFNRSYKIVKLYHPEGKYVYTSDRVWTVWGFIKKKTGEIHSPINSKKPGNVAESFTQWTAMPPPKLNPLEQVLFA